MWPQMLESNIHAGISNARERSDPPAHSAERFRRFLVLHLEPKRAVHATGASDTVLLEIQFYGCLVPRLYNRGRPHSSLGPGIPDSRSSPPARKYRHHLEPWEKVTSTSVLGGLHHEYQIKRSAA